MKVYQLNCIPISKQLTVVRVVFGTDSFHCLVNETSLQFFASARSSRLLDVTAIFCYTHLDMIDWKSCAVRCFEKCFSD